MKEMRHQLSGQPAHLFSPEPPRGSPASNWIPTVPGRAWFTYFRLYAPLPPYFDQSWTLPDIEEDGIAGAGQ